MKSNETEGFRTKLIHAGEPKPPICGAVTLPVFQSSTFEYFNEEESGPIKYIRLSNTPNHTCLQEKLAALEGAEGALVMASGMAAIATMLLSLVGEGEHLLAQDNLYGGAFQFLKEDFPAMGRKVSFFPLDRLEELERHLTPKTRALYVESISNPLMRVPDLARLAQFARQKGLLAFIDNTFPSPVNFNPIPLGYDVVVHSATKYLNGHSDIVAGALAGKTKLLAVVAKRLKHFGASLDPHSCFLLNRGVKTLALRVEYQNASALRIASWLEKQPKISCVLYPGLPSHPDHGRARDLFRGFGGMLAFEYAGDARATDAFLKRLTLPFIAPSLGGVETLCTRPVMTSHSWLSAAEREKIGIRDNLVRVSVGLEDTDDVIRDFSQALA